MENNSSETQPLVEEQELTEEEIQAQKAQQNWQNLVSVFTPQLQPHGHGPFVWLLNQSHNALRGCTTCGQTWVGVMAGVDESDLQWHLVQESPEEEE